jgi:microcystin-dependent protein
MIWMILTLAAFCQATVTETTNKTTYDCNGSVTNFVFSFPIVGTDTSQIMVILREESTGDETTLAETTHYTVSAVNNDYSGGGTVTTVDTYSGDYQLTILRDTPRTQTTDLTESRILRASTLENAYDKITLIAQDLYELLDRSLKLPKTDTQTDLEIPDSVTRANKYLAFDDDGDPIASSGPAGASSIPVSSYMETVLDDITAADARTTLGSVGLTGTETIAGTKIFSSLPVIPAATPTTSTQAASKGYVDSAAATIADAAIVAYMPPGVILPYGGSTAPTGWLLCDGATLTEGGSGQTYQYLYAVIGTTFGGTGETDFDLPDLRGRTIIGLDNMGGASADRVTDTDADSLGGADGEETHTLSIAEMPAHTHDLSIPKADNASGSGRAAEGGDTPTGNFSISAGATTTGGGGAHNNMQPYMALNYIIRY